jgi:hypothetical protein
VFLLHFCADTRERSYSSRALVKHNSRAIHPLESTEVPPENTKAQSFEVEEAPRPNRMYSRTEFYNSAKGRESEVLVFIKHFKALLKKRAIYGMRDRRVFICQLVLPTIVVLVGLGILQITPSYDQPGIRLVASGTSPRCLISELNVFQGSTRIFLRNIVTRYPSTPREELSLASWKHFAPSRTSTATL